MIIIFIAAFLLITWIVTKSYLKKRTLYSKKKKLNARLSQCLDSNKQKNIPPNLKWNE